VARDLHDDIGQILTAIRMDLNWIEKRLTSPSEEMSERLKSAMNLADNSLIAVRKVCSALRPAMLDDLGLAPAIEWQTSEFSSKTGIRCEVSVPRRQMRLNPATATAIFRIYQECLTNIMRHAQANSVRVSLYERSGNAYFCVEDDGKGFREAEVSGSLGLLGMKERARGCGGELRVESSPGKGTTVTLKVPK
jgi:two-component system sensor histidine kinase UhpB